MKRAGFAIPTSFRTAFRRGLPYFLRLEPVLLIIVMATLLWQNPSPAGATVKSGFTDTLVANIDSPTDITFTPGGRIMVTTQGGKLYVLNGSTPVLSLNLTAKICSDFERGMLGVILDPLFSTNHYVYVYYTFNKNNTCTHNVSTAPVNRVSRFTMSGDIVSPGSETVLLDNIPSPNGNHNAGDLEFGKDGYLYVSIGDGGCEIGSSGECGGDNDNARRKDIPNGKIFRITRDGGIPSDNPFKNSSGGRCATDGIADNGQHCQETFAWGLRNPFRLAMDPNASGTKFYINDVGQNIWEEIDSSVSGADYGWNTREGFCPNGSTSGCGNAPSGMTNPVFAYQHDGCNSITGGAFVPTGAWGSSYNGVYLYADYVCGKIFQLKNGTSTQFGSNLGPLTTLKFGPYNGTQALYYSSYSGEIRRISSTTGNRAPTASGTATPAYGLNPLQVTLNGSSSLDPDGDTLTYDWDFGDNSNHGTGVQVQHTFTTNQIFNVKLTVNDGKGGTGTTTIKVDVGNTAPVPQITSPGVSDLFAVGDVITLTGSATDAQDGALPNSSLSWKVFLHHDTHEHPLVPAQIGNNIQFTAPSPEDLLAATNSYLRIELTATDSTGIKTTISQNFNPNKVQVTIDSDPSGLDLILKGAKVTGPTTVTSWEGNILEVSAPDTLQANGEALIFTNWSVPGTRDLAYVTPDEDSPLTAEYSLVAGPSFAPVADARVKESTPTLNEGKVTGLTSKGSSTTDYESFLRFDVTGVSGTVTSARIFFYSYDGTTDGPAIYKTSASWTETGITWNNKPASSGTRLSDSGSIPAKTWFSLDVSKYVKGNGSFNVLLRSFVDDQLSVYSRESSSRQPRLVITTSGTSDTSEPSIPEDLRFDAPDSSTIKLDWTASIDDVGVTGYDVFRDGVLISSTGTNSYTDTALTSDKTYRYKIRARDAGNNLSDLSEELVAETPPLTVTKTFTPIADAYVKESSANTNYGTNTQLRAEGGSDPDIVSYLKFSVSGLTGGVYRATLRVYIPAGSGNGTDDGPAIYNAGSSWNETVITWTNKPGTSNTFDDQGPLGNGIWVDYDVSATISGNSTQSWALISSSTDVVVFSSREGANPPQLIVTAFTNGRVGSSSVEEPTAATTPSATATPLAIATSSAIADLPFSDGFETGNLSNWSATNAETSNAIAKKGNFSLIVKSEGSSRSAGTPSYALHTFSTERTEIYASASLYVDSQGTTDATLLTVLGKDGRAIATVLRSKSGHLNLRNERTGNKTDLGEISENAWHTLQVHLLANGANSNLELWLDGDLLYSQATRFRNGGITGIELGDRSKTHTFAIAFDSVAFESNCIGTCPTALVTPQPTTDATTEPTDVPVTEPATTAIPTDEPTTAPTVTPTDEPIATDTPTDEPTDIPTVEPEQTEQT